MPSKEIDNIFKPRKKKRKIIKYLKYSICTALVLVVGYTCFVLKDLIIDSVSNAKESQSNIKELQSSIKKSQDEVLVEVEKDIDYLAKIPQSVINSDDAVTQTLLEKANDNPKIAMILSDKERYPKDLLELASKKDEVIDFVANFPNRKTSIKETISIEDEYTEGEIPHFIQWDERWGYEKYGPDYFAINGCGPSSLAMVIVGLTGNTDVNPKVIAKFSEDNGHIVGGVGTSWQLMTEGAKAYGLKCEELPLNENTIIKTLKKGQPIIISMAPGTFTSVGHYVVLTGVDSDGKIIVKDSDSKIRTNKTWDIDVFMKEAKNLWTFTAL